MPAVPTLAQFVATWRTATLTEQAGAQSHFLQLCAMLGVAAPASVDQTGSSYTFEKRLTKAAGGGGRADVWKRGAFGWEYKGPGGDLDKAYQQLLQYRDALENPPLLVVSDFNRFHVHTNFNNTARRTYAFTLADLLENRPTPTCALPPLTVLRALFTDPEALHPQQTTAAVTEEAARRFAALAAKLRAAGVDPQAAAHFLMRLLFCLFAEDSGLLPAQVFSRLLDKSRMRTLYLQQQLQALFAAMATGGDFWGEEIRAFNGGLFDDTSVYALDSDDILILIEAAKLDWASVEPAIFGTLFERGLAPTSRARLGAHYTSKEDILLIVEPVLMAPLRREWTAIQAAVPATLDPGERAALGDRLTAFRADLAGLRILDPACGSGNFLYVALQALLTLEKEVIVFGTAYGLEMAGPTVAPEQLYGIELNPYAQQLASIVVWIGYIQWMRENGFPYDQVPVLRPLTNIRWGDAILAEDGDRPVEPPWPVAAVILGNPPFLGSKRLRAELGDHYVERLFTLYAGRVPHEADLVCYWFERARAHLEAGQVARVGLLATQGIRGGVNRKVLEAIKATGDIFMAWSDRDWILDGAAVHVSLVGFDGGAEQERLLDGVPVGAINANLTSKTDLTQARLLTENRKIAFMGDIKVGPFDIPADLAHQMLAASGNPNGRPNSDVIKPWVNGLDITGRPRNMWIIDFGVAMPEEEAALYELPFEYVRRHVKPMRLNNNMKKRAVLWWIHGDSAPRVREALTGLTRYIATPTVSKHRVFTWLTPPTVADHQLIVFAREDDYFFGVLQSRFHELWARGQGTQVREAESGFRYTPTSTFETFPFPWPPGQEPLADPRVAAIAEAARDLVARREAALHPVGGTAGPPRTLTALYNARPTWLDQAHARLDAAVATAYGWPADLADAEVLARLLALNAARAGRA